MNKFWLTIIGVAAMYYLNKELKIVYTNKQFLCVLDQCWKFKDLGFNINWWN